MSDFCTAIASAFIVFCYIIEMLFCVALVLAVVVCLVPILVIATPIFLTTRFAEHVKKKKRK